MAVIIHCMFGALKILERAIAPSRGGMAPELARQVLAWDFPPEDHARAHDLGRKAQLGTLSKEEEAELDDYLAANDMLAILQSKARVSLKQQTPAA